MYQDTSKKYISRQSIFLTDSDCDYILEEIFSRTTIDGQILIAGELVVNAKYLCSMQVDTNWYWNQHPQHHIIIILTRTILHPRVEVNAVVDFHAIPKSVCIRKQARKSISRQPICLTDFEYFINLRRNWLLRQDRF